MSQENNFFFGVCLIKVGRICEYTWMTEKLVLGNVINECDVVISKQMRGFVWVGNHIKNHVTNDNIDEKR